MRLRPRRAAVAIAAAMAGVLGLGVAALLRGEREGVGPVSALPHSFPALAAAVPLPAPQTPATRPATPPPQQAAVAATPQRPTLAVHAPRRLGVGEMADLAVSVGSHAGIASIGFTVSVDANVLQIRAAAQGDWAAGAGERFDAEIADTEDRVYLRSAVPVHRSARGGSVAVVQLQALAPGSTAVLIGDVVASDAAGRPVNLLLSVSSLQLEVQDLSR